MPSGEPKLLIVDDCTLHRENLVAVFANNGSAAPRAAWDLPSLFDALAGDPPHLVLINVDARDSTMLIRATLEVCPESRVIVLGMSEDDEAGMLACAEAGVAGYHLRNESLADLFALMRRVANGESLQISASLFRRMSALAASREPVPQQVVLTSREAEILGMLEMGLSNRDIADRLCIAVYTVKNHVHSILTKLGAKTRAEAAARARGARPNVVVYPVSGSGRLGTPGSEPDSTESSLA